MKLFLDGDIILYRAGFAAERTKYTLTAPGIKTQSFNSKRELMDLVQGLEIEEYYVAKERIVEPVEHALSNTRNILNDIFASVPKYNVDRDQFQIFLSGSSNFRKKIDPEYKAHRDKTYKPHWTNEIQNYLKRYWDATLTDGHEADDAIAVGAMNQEGDHYIVSSDKDFNQLPYTSKFNFVSREVTKTSRNGALEAFLGQLVQGDAADNVKGIYGIGPAKWRKIVEESQEHGVVHAGKVWDRVLGLYQAEYKDAWEHRLVKNFYLLRLPRYWDEIPNEQDIQRIVSGEDAKERIKNIKVQATEGLIEDADGELMPELPREGMPELPLGGLLPGVGQGEINPPHLQQAMRALDNNLANAANQAQVWHNGQIVNNVWGVRAELWNGPRVQQGLNGIMDQ